ncbi:MAG TPA: hypothetical protein VMV05_08285, partial [bacterium]|nr:hypothetical protein [bacterium]
MAWGSYTYCSPTTITETNAPTHYSLTGLVNCSYQNAAFDTNHYAAIATQDWENSAACGACLVALNGSMSTTVMVVDQCPSSSNAPCVNGTHHIDFASPAYNELVCGSPTCSPGGPPSTIQWYAIPCPLAYRNKVGSGGNLAYTFKSGCSTTWAEILFLNQLVPLTKVQVSNNGGSSWTNLGRETYDYWGGNAGGAAWGSGPYTFQLTDGLGAVVTVSGINGFNPVETSYSSTSVQFPACNVTVVATNTPTKTYTGTPTSTPNGPTNTPTRTYTSTTTKTFTPTPGPPPGCPFYYYSGASPHALTNLSTFTNAGGTSTLTETAGAAQNGETAGLNFGASVSATGYYAQWGLNWTNYTPTSQWVVNLNNYSNLVFYMQNTNAAVSPMTFTAKLADVGGAGSTGVTASNPVTFVLTGTASTMFQFPTSSFSTGGASYSVTNVGELDIEWLTSAAAQATTVYFGGLAFYGTCPTNTPTPTNTATLTRTPTPTNTLAGTPTNTPTATRTNTATNTMTFTPTRTFTNTPTGTSTNTSASTSTNTMTNTATQTRTNTSTSTRTNTATNTVTSSPTSTVLSTATNTSTSSATLTRTNTPTSTQTNTGTSTSTPTRTNTATNTMTASATNTATRTNTFTATNTLVNTGTFTSTATHTSTNSFTPTR